MSGDLNPTVTPTEPFRVGGLRFLRIGRVQISVCICKPEPSTKVAKVARRAAWRAGYCQGSYDTALFGLGAPPARSLLAGRIGVAAVGAALSVTALGLDACSMSVADTAPAASHRIVDPSESAPERFKTYVHANGCTALIAPLSHQHASHHKHEITQALERCYISWLPRA